MTEVNLEGARAWAQSGGTMTDYAKSIGVPRHIVQSLVERHRVTWADLRGDRKWCKRGHDLSRHGVRSEEGWTRCQLCRRMSTSGWAERRQFNRSLMNEGKPCPRCNALDWRVSKTNSGRVHCGECARRAAEATTKSSAIAVAKKAVPQLYTWQDYADTCDREFSTPPYLREAPKIKAWLIANKVKP